MTTVNYTNKAYTTMATSCGVSERVGFLYSRTSGGANSLPAQIDSSGYLKPNPYSRDDVFVAYRLFRWKQTLGGPWLTCSTDAYDTTLATMPLSWKNEADIRALLSLREQVMQGDYNLAVSVGEARESLHMIGNTAISLANSLLHLRRGNVQAAIKSLRPERVRSVGKLYENPLKFRNRISSKNFDLGPKASKKPISESWLELQYGWLPLLSDAKSAAEKAYRMLNEPKRFTFRSFAKAPSYKDTYVTGSLQRDRAVDYQCAYFAYVVEDDSVVPSWARDLGLLDPELLVWELLPFSFVADWFLPIGSYLEARSFATRPGITFIKSTKEFAKGGGNWKFTNAYKLDPANMPPNLQRYTLKVRRTTGPLDVPLPHFKPLSKALSLKHCLNGMALLSVISKRVLS